MATGAFFLRRVCGDPAGFGSEVIANAEHSFRGRVDLTITDIRQEDILFP